jgi:acyl-coenzyme A thioesterase PaaI-like protein
VEDVSAGTDPTVALGSALRRLMNAAVLTNAGDDDIAAAARAVDNLAADLESSGLRASMRLPDEEGMRRGQRPYSPVIGTANPIAPPLTVRVLDDCSVVGECTMRPIHEGPPGAVHGGWVATLLDQLLGHATAASGNRGFTAELTVRYRRPTPYGVPLTLRGRTEDVDGRRVRAAAEIVVDGVVTAEASALFLVPSQERIAELHETVAARD